MPFFFACLFQLVPRRCHSSLSIAQAAITRTHALVLQHFEANALKPYTQQMRKPPIRHATAGERNRLHPGCGTRQLSSGHKNLCHGGVKACAAMRENHHARPAPHAAR